MGLRSKDKNVTIPSHPLQQIQPVLRKRKHRTLWISTVALLVLWLIAVMLYQTHKPLPTGISYESPLYHVNDVQFWKDLTYVKEDDQFVHEQEILKRILQIVEDSRKFLVIDLFLFNNYTHEGDTYPQVSRTLANKLITQQRKYPEMDIVFITDEVNTNYGSAPNELLEDMKSAGIRVIMTDVNSLRDSTPIYSSVWRTFIQWFGQSGTGWLPNLMADQGPKITLRSYLDLLNVKANHRKLVVSENTALISSGNVHDASAFHSNIAFEVQGDIIQDILTTEQAAANLSDADELPKYQSSVQTESQGPLGVRYLTEGKVYKYVLLEIEKATQGDTLWMGMFYLADENVMNALLDAAKRGVDVRLILDPNQNAFGRDMIGIPNRPVAAELFERSDHAIQIRWYNTTKEQYHSKLMYISKPSNDSIIIGGSTNFTPRNLDDYNLENDLWVSIPSEQPLNQEMQGYFNRLWSNESAQYTLPLDAYQENSTWLKDIVFRLQKILGLTTF